MAKGVRLSTIRPELRRRLRALNDLPLDAQAQRLGLSRPQVERLRSTLIQAGELPSKRRALAADGAARIRRLAGHGLRIADIAARMELSYERTLRLMRQHGIVMPEVERWTIAHLERLLGVTDDAIYLWIERGWLPTRDAADERDVRKRYRVITRQDLQRFLHERDAWPSYEPRLCQDDALRELGEALRRHAGGRWLSRKELAREAGLAPNSLNSRLDGGWLSGWRWVRHRRARYVWWPDGALLPAPQGDRWASRRARHGPSGLTPETLQRRAARATAAD